MVKRGQEQAAFYSLTNPQQQVKSYVFDALRAIVPRVNLDELFVIKEKLADEIKQSVQIAMQDYGYSIMDTPIIDIEPDPGVKQAMNEINRQERLKKAAEDKGEAAKILAVKDAEAHAAKVRIVAQAEADSAELQGQGISRQRQAIVDGLEKSVNNFREGVPGVQPNLVIDMVLISQYFDTLKDIAANNKSNAVFMPYGSGAVNDITSQLRQGIMEANAARSFPAPGEGKSIVVQRPRVN